VCVCVCVCVCVYRHIHTHTRICIYTWVCLFNAVGQPMKGANLLVVVDRGGVLIIWILDSLTWVPSSKTTYPRETTYGVNRSHFPSLAYIACCFSSRYAWVRWSIWKATSQLYAKMLSWFMTIDFSMKDLRTSFVSQRMVLGTFDGPKGITGHS